LKGKIFTGFSDIILIPVIDGTKTDKSPIPSAENILGRKLSPTTSKIPLYSRCAKAQMLLQTLHPLHKK